MEKLKNIRAMLKSNHIKYEYDETGQRIYIKACNIGNNFYDYDEPPKPIQFYPKWAFLKNDHRICILKCEDCCGCAGW